jgi:L-gulonolactone oxidase
MLAREEHPEMATVQNWAETYSSTPYAFKPVDTLEELSEALREATRQGAHVRVLGAAQSPSDIAMTNEHMIAIRGLNRIREIDRERCEVVAETGITLGELSVELDRSGLALPNLGSILRQTLGGAAATGTHGTGVRFGSFSTYIQELEMLTADGSLVRASATENPDLFAAGRLSLGSLGVQTAFRLKVVPAFDLRVEEGPVQLERAMDPEWYGSADHARVWYLPYVDHAWGWRAFRVPPGTRPRSEPGFWSRLRTRALGYHAFQAGLWLAASLPELLPAVNRAYADEFLSQPRRSVGTSVDQFTFDCLFHQYVSEWAVPLPQALPAVMGVRDLAETEGAHAHLPIEIRFTAGDDIWLSPTFGGPRCWIGVVSYIPWGREIEWKPFFAAFEEQMLARSGRPHWAKYFAARGETLRGLYPCWDRFQHLRASLDPLNRLRNAYTDRVFGSPAAAG